MSTLGNPKMSERLWAYDGSTVLVISEAQVQPYSPTFDEASWYVCVRDVFLNMVQSCLCI